MKERRRARQIALELLYQMEIAGLDVDDAVSGRKNAGHPVPQFTIDLVEGVVDKVEEIDAWIEKFAKNWSIERMPILDRNVTRIAIFEMLNGDVPHSVAINEAVEMAKRYGTADSGKFVNGILSSVANELNNDGRQRPDIPEVG